MKKAALYMTYLYFLICPLEFIFNRYFGSSVKYIAIVAAAFMLMFFIGSRKVPMRFGSIQICVGAWAIFEAASYLWTIHSKNTLSMLITYMMMAILVFAVSLFPFDTKNLEACLTAYTLGCVILSLLLFVVGQTYEERLTIKVLGSYQDPNSLAAILLSGSFFALYKTFQKPVRTVIPNIFYAICFTATTLAIFATSSRGALIAYVTSFFIYLVIITPKPKRWQIFITVPIALLLSYIVLKLTLPANTFHRLFDFNDYIGGNGRIGIWSSVLQEIIKRPLLGHGVLSHQGYFYQQVGYTYDMHNTFLFLLFEVGAVGLALFLIPFIKTYLYAAKNKNALICAIIVANIIAAFFLDALNHRYLWNALMFGIIYYNANCAQKQQKSDLLVDKP